MSSESEQTDNDSDQESHQKLKAELIIRNNVILGLGSGLIPSPAVDLVALTAIELKMIGELAELYQFRFPGRLALYKVLISVVASLGPIYLSTHYRSLFKGVPIVGPTLVTAILSLTSGLSVYAVGKLFQRHFESGGRFLSGDRAEIRRYYKQQQQRGREMVEGLEACRT